MQTKNINVERAPTTTAVNINIVSSRHSPELPEKLLIRRDGLETAPPLPPRGAIIFSALSAASKDQVEVKGYGPYKPVPPPKPLQEQQVQQNAECLTPPPYRMPPYPLYNETSIPGAASLDLNSLSSPAASSNPSVGLQTHSSKFPIEREVVISSTDKNTKIPILHDYMKRTKAAMIAPDVPPKQMAAWTVQGPTLAPDQIHTGHVQMAQPSQPDQNGSVYRSTGFHPSHDYYSSHQLNNPSTGAVPRSSWHGDPSRLNPQQSEEIGSHSQSVNIQMEPNKETNQKDSNNKNSKSMTKTYHTIKDIISSRFKSNKDNDDKSEEVGLNNCESMRKSGRSIDDREKQTVGEQGIYGRPRTDQNIAHQQHQYNQHVIQQHLIAQQAMQAQQQYQAAQQFKNQQNESSGQQHLTHAKSQEILTARADEQKYYQNACGSAPQRPINRYGMQQLQAQRDSNYMSVLQSQLNASHLEEKRSAQQLERDNLRQRSFETRRAASHPQLAYEDRIKNEHENKPQPQTACTPMRRGSHGNIIEAATTNEKDSDDGGFLSRNSAKNINSDHNRSSTTAEGPCTNNNSSTIEAQDGYRKNEGASKNDSKVSEALTGMPRKQLEGEIGKIEGVYNVGHRSKVENEDVRNLRKPNAGSGTSSDYDKAGQSSSNADSGRGSAAYSSGRRPDRLDTNNDNCDVYQLQSNSCRDIHSSAHEAEWVDIVESELRHILEPKLHDLTLQGSRDGVANSTMSESISSMTPPLPPLSPGDQSSPNVTPRNSTRYKHSSLPYGSKPDYDNYGKAMKSGHINQRQSWHHNSSQQKYKNNKKLDHSAIIRGKQMFGFDTLDLTSTTTRSLDLESMLDGQSDSDGDISTTDAKAIRKQLEGLESMYSEVLKLLGVKRNAGRYQPSDPRFCKRRYGSMSSLPSSSVSSRPIRDKRRTAHEERKKVRDMRGINKRFQRLESHVVTLARSVAHLSSEMRTQHLMIQEMESIRGEIATLRTQTNMLNVRSQSASRANNSSKDLPSLANPTRVKKLTKFFGDEPPLVRLFLRKLGYEKYANVFENEKVGMVELPYLTEERLQKMGVPLGPRLRIMQEAQISVYKENTLCIV